MTTPPSGSDDPLATLVQLPGVAAAVESARVACEELRWHEAFRRRWREVRAEADLHAARASAAVDGARVPLGTLRAVAVGGAALDAADPAARASSTARSPGSVQATAAERLAVGALRASVLAATWRADLGGRGESVLPPFVQMLARLHVAATAGWLPADDVGRLRAAAAPRDLTGLGAAPSGQELAARVQLLGRTVEQSRAPGLVVAAVVHAELLALRPFAAGNGVVARAASRLLLTARGLDPTGTVLPEVGWAAEPNPYLASAAGFATGSPTGVAGWLVMSASAVVRGAAEAGAVAEAVQAGRVPG